MVLAYISIALMGVFVKYASDEYRPVKFYFPASLLVLFSLALLD